MKNIKNTHTIRFCMLNESKKLMDFINQEWKKGHILAKSKELLDFQHLNTQEERYNFVVAFNEKSKEFDAVLGFIETKQYDRNIQAKDIWLAIWKVKEQYANTGIGLNIILELENLYKPNSVGAIGISNLASKIYRFLKYQMGTMQHYFIKNEQCREFQIASFVDSGMNLDSKNADFCADSHRDSKPCVTEKKIESKCYKIINDKIIEFKELEKSDILQSNINITQTPHKSLQYFINRYALHRFYHYRFIGIYKDNHLKAIFVYRIQEANNAKCMRIIDYLGDFIPNCYTQFQNLLIKNQCEYVDLLCFVPNESEILAMGFSLKVKEIIPNYFEPFVKENVSINFAYKSIQKYRIFKGDSDQDRPNTIETQYERNLNAR